MDAVRYRIGVVLALLLITGLCTVLIIVMSRAVLWLLVFAPGALIGVVCFTAFLTVLAMALTKDWGK